MWWASSGSDGGHGALDKKENKEKGVAGPKNGFPQGVQFRDHGLSLAFCS